MNDRPQASETSAAIVDTRRPDGIPQAVTVATMPRSTDAVVYLSPLHSLRRRWPQMLCAGTICAAILWAGAWVYFKPKFHTYASLRIHSQAPQLAFKVDETELATQFDIYKRTQRELVLGDEVLLAALRDPKIAKHSQIKAVAETEDAVVWLRGQLQVAFPGDAEIMTISVVGDQPAFIADVVNAVLDAYVAKVIDAGKQDRSERLAMLRKALSDQDEKVRRLRNTLEDLTESLGSGDADALSAKQQVAIQRYAQLQTEYARVQFERLGEELKLASLADQVGQGSATSGLLAPIEKATPADVSLPGGGLSSRLAITDTLPATRSDAPWSAQALAAQRQAVQTAESELAEIERRVAGRRGDLTAPYRDRVERERRTLQAMEEAARQEMIHQRHIASKLASRDAQSALLKQLEESKRRVKMLQVHESLLAESLAEATEEADKLGTSSVNVELTRKELERLERVNDRLGMQVETLTIELSSPPRVEALGRAREPQAASGGNRLKKTTAFGVLGFLMPCIGLLWLDARRQHVNDESDIHRLAALRSLGSIPIVPRVSVYRRHQERCTLALREAVDCIRTVLLREAELSDCRILQITSAMAGEAKTTFATQLAKSLARAHRHTALVDFDLRFPALHAVFDMPPGSGTCELLRGELKVDDVLRSTELDHLQLILAGHCDRAALEALTERSMDALVGRLRDSFEFVIIDSSPVLPVVDALLVAQRADATIVTALRDVTRTPYLEEATTRLRQVGATIMGAVITTNEHHSYYDARQYAAAGNGIDRS